MKPFRRRSGGPARTAEHDPTNDIAIVRDFKKHITVACIDLMDVPVDIAFQQRVIEVLLHDAPRAEQAITRLNNSVVPH